MKVFILVALVAVCIVGLSKAAPYRVDQQRDGDETALLQALLSRMLKKFAAKQELQQALLNLEDAEEEGIGCECITSPCPCDKQHTGERENGFDYDMDLNKEQQKKALVQEDPLSAIAKYFEQQEMKEREQAEEEGIGCECITSPCPCDKQHTGERENGFDYDMDLNKEQQKKALVQEDPLSAIAKYFEQQEMKEAEEEGIGCECITSPCPCDKQHTGERENGFDYDMDLNMEKQRDQQKKALVQDDILSAIVERLIAQAAKQ